MSKQLLIPPFDKKVHLTDYDPAYTNGYEDEKDIQEALESDLKKLADLQGVLYASAEKSVLIVIQAMDTGGKDGTITHVFRGLNPAGVDVKSFKQPSPEDLKHDFLWRVHSCVPGGGMIGVFNRSHYEDVLVARVHELVPKKVWKKRYDQINAFEQLLSESGATILKFFLHISKDEQKKRLEARLEHPEKYWKFNPDDLKERERWDDYMEAYEAVLNKCNTDYAPWHIVPSDHKWYRNYAVTRAIVQAMNAMKLEYPPATVDLKEIKIPD